MKIHSKHIHFPKFGLRLTVPWIIIPLPRIAALPLPRAITSPEHPRIVLASAVMGSGVILAIALFFAIEGVSAGPPVWPEAAMYDASLSQRLGQEEIRTGKANAETKSQTLRLNIAGARLHDLTFKNLSIGAGGLTSSIVITGDLDATGDLMAYIECEDVVFDGVVATSFTATDNEAYRMTLATNTADGNSFSYTLSATPSDIVFGGGRGLLNVGTVDGGSYDRIILDVGASNATCNKLEFNNIKSLGGGISVDALKVGEFTVRNSLIGSGSGTGDADFTFTTAFKIANAPALNDNTEQNVSVK